MCVCMYVCVLYIFMLYVYIYIYKIYNIYILKPSLKNSGDNLLNIFLYRKQKFTARLMNKEILKCRITFLKKLNRFSCPLFYS